MADRASKKLSPAKIIAATLLFFVLFVAGKCWRAVAYAPDPEISAPLLDAIFAKPNDVIGKDKDGGYPTRKMQRPDIAEVSSFDCYARSDGLTLTSTRYAKAKSPSYDCVYRLKGTDGANYLAVEVLTYLPDAKVDDEEGYIWFAPYVVQTFATAQSYEMLTERRIVLP